jgi:hypothetical protein
MTMIIKQSHIPGTSFQRREYEDGTVLDRRNVYLSPSQWEKVKKLAAVHEISASKLIGQLVDQAMASVKHSLHL